MSAIERSDRTAEADRVCAAAYADQGGPDNGAALVAVGGYGRGELAPYSDWDLVLVHDDARDLGEFAGKIWYPLWDSGARIDHSVRALAEMVDAAAADIRVALGLLDVRHVAGDPNLTLRLRTTMLAHWRSQARAQLPALRALTVSRHERMGELAHAAVPDLKESAGGLRDATVLKALVATWLIDLPHAELEACRQGLLDLRDILHAAAGRATDRITPEYWPEIATALDLDEAAAQRHTRELGRRMTHLSRLAWRRADAALSRSRRVGNQPPRLTSIGSGLALSGGEVVLDRGTEDDPVLLLRAAVETAERQVLLAPATAARLAALGDLPSPWSLTTRQLFVRLIGSGRGLLPVWETLEETGALDRILPEWERIRLLPHATIVHRYTVDRHCVETCIEAADLIRDVGRPDILLVAALLHDIGKGSLIEHSVAGAPIAREAAARMGFTPADVDLIGTLVRWHLMLVTTATIRDPDDPATVELITSTVGSRETLALLLALTEADARATGPQAWTSWREHLVRRLAAAAAERLGDPSAEPHEAAEIPIPAKVRDGRVHVEAEPATDGSRVTIIGPDRVGFLADVAAAFALMRIAVRAARVWSADGYGAMTWEIAEPEVDVTLWRTRFEAVAQGRIDPAERLRRPAADGLPPSVVVRPEASRTSTVLEVRTSDRIGTVYRVCAALASLDIAVRSAHVDTLGPQAVDVFYLTEEAAGPLGEARAAEASRAVWQALAPQES